MEVANIIAHVFLFTSLYFEVFLLLTFIERRDVFKEETGEPESFPSVTVLVPSFNEGKTLAGTINSILALDYPKDKLQVFIIDDGSTDNTSEIAQDFTNNPMIKSFKKENGGKYTALNLGLKHATTDLVGCLDADSFVDTKALKRIVKRFENKEVMAVTPSIKVFEPKNTLELIQSGEYTLSLFIRKVFAFIGSVYITPGPFSFFRREVFEKIGEYKHAHNTEDLEIALRMQMHNLQIDNAHDAYVYTKTPKTLRALFKQRLRWIHGFLENMKDYRFMYFKRGYGNLSFFILPMATVSIFTALYFTSLVIVKAVGAIGDKITEVSAIGVNFSMQTPTFDWFYINTQSVFLLSLTLIIITGVLILIGKYVGEGKVRLSRDMFYFMVLYSFIAPFWLAKAVYQTALSRKTSWR